MITIAHASRKAIAYSAMNFHYAKKIPNVSVPYSIYEDGEWCGTVLFGPGNAPNAVKRYGIYSGEYLELLRVALNGKQKTTSQVVAACIRQLKKDEPLVRMLISYADSNQGHVGTIYQAMNWIYVGRYSSSAGIQINGKLYHRRTVSSLFGTASISKLKEIVDENCKEIKNEKKYKYIYVIDKKLLPLILNESLPYEKNKRM